MKVVVTYPEGRTPENCTSSATSLEDFVNEKFGSSYESFVERGGSVAEVDEFPAPEAPQGDQTAEQDPDADGGDPAP